MPSPARFTLALGLLAVLWSRPAHAYIDPSTGSYVLQILVAGFLGGMFALKVFWRRIVAVFRNLTSQSKSSASASESTGSSNPAGPTES